MALCAFCYFSDYFIRPGAMVTHLLPAAAYGGFVFLVLYLNPLLRLFGVRFALTGREVAIILSMFLIACGLPDISLGKSLSNAAMWPLHLNRITPSWNQVSILEMVPEAMFCDLSGPDGDAGLEGFVTGLATGDERLEISELPWGVWRRPALFWGPLVFSFLIAVFGLAVVFHRQWSSHEQLAYPIVQFASSLLPGKDGSLSPTVRNRLFIIGFLFAFSIYVNNYCVRWFPQVCIPVKLWLNFHPFTKVLPIIVRGKGWGLFGPQIILTVIGLAYFLPSEASLSMWIGPWLFCLFSGICATYGVQLRSSMMMALAPEPFIYIGAYSGLMFVILYSGRHYYWNTLKQALWIRSKESIPEYAIWGMRLFLGGIIFFVIYLHLRTDIHWTLGVFYAAIAVTTYSVVSRVLAETGAFEIGTVVYPGIAAWGFFGEVAVGPAVLISMFMLSVVLLSGPGWCVMPFLNQALKLSEGRHVPLSRFSRWGLVTMLLGIVVMVPCTLYWQYNSGSHNTWGRISSAFPFNNGVEMLLKLRAQGLEAEALGRKGMDYLAHLSPHWNYVMVSVVTFALAIFVAYGRLHFTWWPLHPVIFIFFGGDQSVKMSFSFGLGFILKTLITKYGGGRLYQKCKPLFIGLIAGMVAGQFVPMVVGAIYYFVTGKSV